MSKKYTHSRSTVRELVARDLKVVEKGARIILEISPEGEVARKENPDFFLDIIAVIGSGLSPRLDWVPQFHRALLCELGLGRGRPHNEAHRIIEGERKHVQPRRNYFRLSEDQYRLVSPIVFKILENLAKEKVASWKTGPTFSLPTPNVYYKRRTKRFEESFSHRQWPRGMRFSVPCSEAFFVSDLYWAEIFGNEQVKRSVRGFANFIDLCLQRYKINGHSEREFRELKSVQPILARLRVSSLPQYLQVEALRNLPNGLHHRHLHNLAKLIAWDLETSRERNLALKALPNPHQRLDGLQVRIVSEKRGYLVFEVFPEISGPLFDHLQGEVQTQAPSFDPEDVFESEELLF